MLRNTFQHLKGIGPGTEARLWREGVLTWEDLARGSDRRGKFDGALRESEQSLAKRNARYFAGCLPSAQRWRIYPDFASEVAFLDIETTGLSSDVSALTVVGVLDSNGYRAFVRGDNLDGLPAALMDYRLIVTFNGAAFDLPFLTAAFGEDVSGHAAHIDLRHVLRRAGYSGGLKAIERRTNTGRPSVLANLSGRDAVSLWHLAQEGEPGALPTLVRYNAEDVASLPQLMALAIEKLSDGTPLTATGLPAFPAATVSKLPYDRSLVDYLAERAAYASSRR